MSLKDDKKYIRRCFALAKRGQGKVSPNPMVGSVIVKDGKILGEGWHQGFGMAHAEAMAIKNAKNELGGATLYVNLEPCCHLKKNTPPCVPLIISAKIKRVVVCNEDPNPQVSGKGIGQLRKAGIEVIKGVLSEEGFELNRFYFSYIMTGRPYIVLKVAQSMDGKIGFNNKEQKWLTGEESIKLVHRMRAQCDAVLVGSNTVKVDNPHLSVRAIKGRNPLKIIVDDQLHIPMTSVVFKPEFANKTLLFTTNRSDKNKISELINRGVKVEQLPSKNGIINLKSIIRRLGERKIISLFVEGGQSIFSQFLEQELFDEIIILQAPVILGKGLGPFTNEYKNKLFIKSHKKTGQDIKIVLRKIN
jgi:diaminohydroxyphosphoribosylaminopyrimidine deaminase / 5-amino-6-(5-phosphoribosylamino)uracil reductase